MAAVCLRFPTTPCQLAIVIPSAACLPSLDTPQQTSEALERRAHAGIGSVRTPLTRPFLSPESTASISRCTWYKEPDCITDNSKCACVMTHVRYFWIPFIVKHLAYIRCGPSL
jgi:hypothetical protein